MLASRGITERQIRWHLSPARIYAYLHAAQMLDGLDMIWPASRAENAAHQQRAWQRYQRWRSLTPRT